MLRELASTIGAGVLFTALTVLPADAATNTITIGRPVTLTDRILVAVPVTVVCDPVTGVDEVDVNASVTQAVGNQVANGQGSQGSEGPGSSSLLTCDGVTKNHLVIDLLPGTGSPPFRYGRAIAQVSFFISASSGDESGGSPFTSVKLVK